MVNNIMSSLCFIFLATLIGNAQNTVGLISYDINKSFDGYNLIYPHNQSNVYLINNCGEIVHTWEGDPETRPGNVAYLLDDGRLVRTHRPAPVAADRIWAGGGGATVEIVDWDNKVEWSFTLNDSTARLHHDISVINKNDRLTIVMIAWEIKNLDEVIAAGRDTSVLASGELWPDFLLEIDPETDDIVWEWHAWDHLIQDFDSTKNNYGNISENPGKLDVNLDFDGTGDADWMHANAVDYDPVNDNIILSVPHFNEIYIIDHTTTTEQAALSIGGLSNKGGDLMYRWGNPINYNQGSEQDQTLFFQHDAAFIDDFVDFFDPNFGKISVFNNRAGADFSTVNIIGADLNMCTYEYSIENEVFLPKDFDFTLTYPEDPSRIFSTGLSSFQYLRNGNALVTSGRMGYSVEITPDNQIVWEYITPLDRGIPISQGTPAPNINSNLTFRMFRYPIDYSAFDGRDLSSKGFIEADSNLGFCDELTDIQDLQATVGMNIYPNPASDKITLVWEVGHLVDIEVVDYFGRLVVNESQVSGGRKFFDTSNWTTGIYIVRINGKEASKILINNSNK